MINKMTPSFSDDDEDQERQTVYSRNEVSMTQTLSST